MENTNLPEQADTDKDVKIGIDELHHALMSLCEAIEIIGNKVEEICKQFGEKTGQYDNFFSNFDRMAQERKTNDGIKGLKDKYGSIPENQDVYEYHSQMEGGDLWETVYHDLEDARQSAMDAASAVEGEKPAEFDEGAFVNGHLGKIREKMTKAEEFAKKKLGKEGEKPKEIKIETTAATSELTPEEEEMIKSAQEDGKKAVERMKKNGYMK